jgi:protein-tyrosine sulfotransferase
MMQQDLGQPGTTPSSGIFVFSLPRTGSTVLRLVLDTHPEIFCPDEIHLGRLLRALYETNEGLAEGSGTSSTSPQLIDGASPGAAATRRMVGELLAAAAAGRGKSLWCDKSPTNIEHMELIDRLLPGSRYVLLHRHCLDFTISCMQFSAYGFFLQVVEDYVRRDHRNYVRAIVRAWNEKTRELLQFEAAHAERCHRLRFEDLVASPEDASRGLFDFLGVGFDPALLERVFATPHHQRALNGDPNAMFSRAIVADGVGRGARLEPRAVAGLPADLAQTMNELLVALGYPAVEITATGFDMRLGKGAAAEGRGEGERVKAEQQAAAGPPAIPAAAIFAMIGQRLAARPDLAGKVRSSFAFVLTGQGGGSWLLDLTEPPGRVVQDGGDGAEVAITTSAADFAAIVAGQLNPAVAAREGRMRVEGKADENTLRNLLGALTGG